VRKLEDAKKNAKKAGFKIVQGFTRPDGSGFAYLDSDKPGGVIYELIQRPKKNQKQTPHALEPVRNRK